ncbi:helix-turn-helix domain-containing transcriptional regulator [Bradyrhizobium guangxiense]|jgi:probable addiction module antidote protein
MVVKLTNYDPADDLRTKEAIAAFMDEAMKTGDQAYIAHARSVVARARAAKSKP